MYVVKYYNLFMIYVPILFTVAAIYVCPLYLNKVFCLKCDGTETICYNKLHNKKIYNYIKKGRFNLHIVTFPRCRFAKKSFSSNLCSHPIGFS